MGEVGHTQLGEDGRLHTVIADPHELPHAGAAVAPAGPQIPSAPRGGRRKSSPLPMILGGLFVVAAIAVPVTIYAVGGFDEEKKPKKTAPARPAPQPAAAPTPTPTPTPTPPPQQRPPQQQPQQKPQQQPPPQQQPQSQPSGSSSGQKQPPVIPSGLATSNPLVTPWNR